MEGKAGFPLWLSVPSAFTGPALMAPRLYPRKVRAPEGLAAPPRELDAWFKGPSSRSGQGYGGGAESWCDIPTAIVSDIV